LLSLWGHVIAVAVIISTLLNLNTKKQEGLTEPKAQYENVTFVKVGNSPVQGNRNAPVTVVEYTDFDCPICRQAYVNILPALRKEYVETNKVKFIYKNLPIADIHPNAPKKAEAAMCAWELAGDQVFFRFHDELFNRYGSTDTADIQIAQTVSVTGLESHLFTACMNSKKYQEFILKDIIEAEIIGSRGTPTWLIGITDEDGLRDTVKMSGMPSYKVFQTVIDQLLHE
jgi:protein-disulfide isomerase